MLTYEEALDPYVGCDDVYTGPLGTKLQPNRVLSDRTDADDGWHLRNINAWLATVYDDGTVEAFDDPDDPLEKSLERHRGTRMEDAMLDTVTTG